MAQLNMNEQELLARQQQLLSRGKDIKPREARELNTINETLRKEFDYKRSEAPKYRYTDRGVEVKEGIGEVAGKYGYGVATPTPEEKKSTTYNLNGQTYNVDIKPAQTPSDYLAVQVGAEQATKAGYSQAAIVNAYKKGQPLLPSDVKTLESDIDKYRQAGYSNAEIVRGVTGMPEPKQEPFVFQAKPEDIGAKAREQTFKQLGSNIDLQTGRLKNETNQTPLEISGKELGQALKESSKVSAKVVSETLFPSLTIAKNVPQLETPEEYIFSPSRGFKKAGEFAITSSIPLAEQAKATTKFFATKSITPEEKKAFEESVAEQKKRSEQVLSDKDVETATGLTVFAAATAFPPTRPLAVIGGTVLGAKSTVERVIEAPTKLAEGKSPTAVGLDIGVDVLGTVAGAKASKGFFEEASVWASTPEGGAPKVGKTETLTQKETPPQTVQVKTTSSEGAVSKGKGTFLAEPVTVVDVFSQVDITPVKAKAPLSSALNLPEDYVLLGERATTVKGTLAKGEVFTQGIKGRAELVQNIEAVSTKDVTQPDLFVPAKQVIKPVTDDIPLNQKPSPFAGKRESAIELAAKAQALGVEPSSTAGLPKGYAEARRAFAELNRPVESFSKDLSTQIQTNPITESTREVVAVSKGQQRLQIKIKGTRGKISSQRVIRTKTEEGTTQEQFIGQGKIRVPKGKPENIFESSKEAIATTPGEEAIQANVVQKSPRKNKTILELSETEAGKGGQGKVLTSQIEFAETGQAGKSIILTSGESQAKFGQQNNVFATGKQKTTESELKLLADQTAKQQESTQKVSGEPVPTAEQIRRKQKAFVEGFEKAEQLQKQKTAPALPDLEQANLVKNLRKKFRESEGKKEITPEQEAALNKELGQTENIFDTILKEQKAKPQEKPAENIFAGDVKLSGESVPKGAQAEVSSGGQTAVFEQPIPEAAPQKSKREIVAEFFMKPFAQRPPAYQIPVTARQLAPTVRSQPQTFGVYSPLYGRIPRGASKVYISQPTPTSREQIRQSVQGQYKVFEEVGRLPREATRERESQKPVEKTLTQPATQYAIKPVQEQAIVQTPETFIKQAPQIKTPFVVAPPRTNFPARPPPVTLTRLDKDEKKDKKKKGLFFARVRRKGVFVKVGKGEESYREAFLKGLKEVRGSAAASFEIKTEEGERPSKEQSLFARQFGDIYSKVTGVFVQKREKRISSSGEKKEITYKGLLARRSKNKSIFD